MTTLDDILFFHKLGGRFKKHRDMLLDAAVIYEQRHDSKSSLSNSSYRRWASPLPITLDTSNNFNPALKI